jgi:hypothetical protein
MSAEELRDLARTILTELHNDGPLGIGGASVRLPIVATGCECDMRCPCNEKCACHGNDACGCNDRCPCNGRQVPAKADWFIEPDPRESRVHLTLDASGPVETLLETLRKVRLGMKAQADN